MAVEQPIEVERPPLGVLRLSSGAEFVVDQSLVLGREPQPQAAYGARSLVKVDTGADDVSRNHAVVLVDGWNVAIRDLGSANGTWVALPGQWKRRLEDNEMITIPLGTTILLGETEMLHFDGGD